MRAKGLHLYLARETPIQGAKPLHHFDPVACASSCRKTSQLRCNLRHSNETLRHQIQHNVTRITAFRYSQGDQHAIALITILIRAWEHTMSGVAQGWGPDSARKRSIPALPASSNGFSTAPFFSIKKYVLRSLGQISPTGIQGRSFSIRITQFSLLKFQIPEMLPCQ